MKILIMCLALGLAGCSGQGKAYKEGVNSLAENCKGKISAEITVSQWHTSVAFRCDDLNFKPFAKE